MADKRDIQKGIENMAIASNELFSTAFDDRPDRAVFLVKDVLEYLGYKNFKIISAKTQSRQSHFLRRDTIVDVEIRLETGEQIIVEVQLTNPNRFPKLRARYVQSSNDVASLPKGENPEKLSPQILIIISKKNLTEVNLPIVTVKSNYVETGEPYDDGRTIVYVNQESRSDKDSPIDLFLDDMFEKDFRKVNSPIAKEILETYKENREGKMQFEEHIQAVFDQELKERLEASEKRYQKELNENKKRFQEELKENRKRYQEELNENKKRHQEELKLYDKKLESFEKIIFELQEKINALTV